jgi:GDPmannose 4,6-dehydratase
VEEAFACAALDPRRHVAIDSRYYRPAEVDLLIGDASKAKEKLGWEAKTKFRELVRLMFDADMELALKAAHMNTYRTQTAGTNR